MTTASHPQSTINACLLPPSFVSDLGGFGFLGLCWHWLWVRSHQLLIPALLLSCLWLQLALWRFHARLLLPPQRPPPSVLLSSLLLLLLPLLYLHQLLKAFRGCWVHNKPILGMDRVDVVLDAALRHEFFLTQKTLVLSSHEGAQCTRAQVSFKARYTTVDSLTTLVRALDAMVLLDIRLPLVQDFLAKGR